MSDEDDVLAANEAFYRAFAERDAQAMDGLWAKASPVACIHPGWPPLLGRAHVMASWRGVLGSPSSPAIRCLDPSAHVLADTAYVICYEALDDARLAATNLFVREDGGWRVVHHQASPVAAEIEVEEDSDPDPSSLN
jgi:ketosteroid isomerase-like protein